MSASIQQDVTIVALCGGIGGAKLALGLYRVMPPDCLTVIVNTGDDFEHMGLRISPDLDTVLYTLGGVADRERGWGREGETWNFMEAAAALGEETWFNLGDRDLAMHVARTRWLRDGKTLTAFAAHAASRLGIRANILPMSDDRVATMVQTDSGELPFQRYFVQQRCEPRVTGIRIEGSEHARPSPTVSAAMADARLRAIVVCPSNPYLSIDPMLAVPGMRAALRSASVPVVAVSPIIGGAAVKGPSAKIMGELDVPRTNAAIAAHYGGLIDGLVIDASDAHETGGIPLPVHAVATLMHDLADRERLARDVMAFADRLHTSMMQARVSGDAP